MTVDFEQNVETLEAPAPAFVASVSEPDAIRILLIETSPRVSLAGRALQSTAFAVRKTRASIRPWRTLVPSVTSTSIVLHCDLAKISPVSICWARLRGLAFGHSYRTCLDRRSSAVP